MTAGRAAPAESVVRIILDGANPNAHIAGEGLLELPPSQTSTGPTAPGGSFFVVTACYDDGSESAPSNEAGAGSGSGAVLTKVKVKSTKITAKGSGFTPTVTVFLDGIPFTEPPTIKNGV